uniref:Uncharacterized protein n=1 Tax=Heterorhabditis bacteriophora TaxID=37862 RepID=A0A1I7XG00_HETBA
MATWIQEPMEPIPEEGNEVDGEWTINANSGCRTISKREIFTSEQVDTLVSTVPKDAVPADWVVENEVVDPRILLIICRYSMATSYITESLAGPASARGTSYTYTYESHYDNPPDVDDEDFLRLDSGSHHQTQKVTRVTKITTTRSVKQIPVDSPYGDIFFDASGQPTPSPVVELEAPVDSLGIRLHGDDGEDRIAPPPAPPLGSRYVNVVDGKYLYYKQLINFLFLIINIFISKVF